jgi:hypothetical protein
MMPPLSRPGDGKNLLTVPGADWLPRIVTALLFAFLCCLPISGKADDRPVTEYQIKAAFLYNFTRFVNWPDNTTQPDNNFTLCVLGIDPFGKSLDLLAGRNVQGHVLNVQRLSARLATDGCRVLYISQSESYRMADILATLSGKPVLTVSDTREFAKQGGMIRLKLVENKVRFDINIDAVERTGLKISSKLLSLATIVKDSGPGTTR